MKRRERERGVRLEWKSGIPPKGKLPWSTCTRATDLLVDGKQVDAGHAWHRTVTFAATQAVEDVQVKPVLEALQDDLGRQANKANGCAVELGVGRIFQRTCNDGEVRNNEKRQSRLMREVVRQSALYPAQRTSSAKALE